MLKPTKCIHYDKKTLENMKAEISATRKGKIHPEFGAVYKDLTDLWHKTCGRGTKLRELDEALRKKIDEAIVGVLCSLLLRT